MAVSSPYLYAAKRIFAPSAFAIRQVVKKVSSGSEQRMSNKRAIYFAQPIENQLIAIFSCFFDENEQ